MLTTPDEFDFIRPALTNPWDEKAWLGARDTSEKNFKWISDDPWTYAPNTSPWEAGKPNGGPAHACLVITRNGELEDSPCDAGWTHHVCERAPTGS